MVSEFEISPTINNIEVVKEEVVVQNNITIEPIITILNVVKEETIIEYTITVNPIYEGLPGPRGLNNYELAVANGFEGTYEQWELTQHGSDGEPFRYEDFTPEQLLALKGNPFVYTDFTPEQLALLKGDTGKSQYQSYLDTTTDNPPLSESQWSAITENVENYYLRRSLNGAKYNGNGYYFGTQWGNDWDSALSVQITNNLSTLLTNLAVQYINGQLVPFNCKIKEAWIHIPQSTNSISTMNGMNIVVIRYVHTDLEGVSVNTGTVVATLNVPGNMNNTLKRNIHITSFSDIQLNAGETLAFFTIGNDSDGNTRALTYHSHVILRLEKTI